MTDNEIKLLTTRADLFRKRVGRAMLRATAPLHAAYRVTNRHGGFEDRPRGRYQTIREGVVWGKAWDTAWFHLTGTVPESWRGRPLAAHLDFNGEGLVFDEAGRPLQGITNGSIFDRTFSRSLVLLKDRARGGEKVELWVEAACNGLEGLERKADPPREDPDRHGTYVGTANCMRLVWMDMAVWHLWIDLKVLLKQLEALSPDTVRHARILRSLDRTITVYADNPDNAEACRAMLRPVLSCRAHASALKVTAVGHAHIDTAWKWPVRESIRKCARSFSSQLRLLQRYPDYVFGASQPQHYQFIKERYPDIYSDIRRAVKAGRWECQGGMWVEADCNLIGGESMVRQFLHGKNFFMDEFGVDVRNLWLPDVFGYSAALPQIMKKAGCDTFVTQKLSWSQFNRFPHSTFRWIGIDGSEALAHFPPENNYNSLLSPMGLSRAEQRFGERGFMDGFLSLFGIGDGGGGPTEEHIEVGLRQRNLEGSPRVAFGSADSFLRKLSRYRDELPTWSGELYLEMHLGTLTTQARVKRGNRMLETRLRQVEWLWSALPLERYPGGALDRLWKTLMLHQFHDILPGSSIAKVYERTEEDYRRMQAECSRLIAKAGRALFKRRKDSLTLVNVLSCEWRRPVELPNDWGEAGAVTEQGELVPVQIENGRALALPTVPAHGAVTLRPKGRAEQCRRRRGLTLENSLVRYEFSEDGAVTRAFDKIARRDAIEPGQKCNVLTLYEDRPNVYDAWDIDFSYESLRLETARAVRAQRLPGGPVREGIRFTLAIGQSEIEQEVFLAADSLRLEFRTRVIWRERHRMLRVAFPVAVRADTFHADIQYGFAARPTHRNTSWDRAKFEVAAHRYVDLSAPDYGVALLNDCKYGHKVHENTIDLNLLRSPTNPDPDADQGQHEFVYALLPHAGDLIRSPVMAEAACLNVPALCFENNIPREADLFPCRIEGRGVSLEVAKKAEKTDELVLRMVETEGRSSVCRIFLEHTFERLAETDLMEWTDKAAMSCTADGIELRFKPFEIRTFKAFRKARGKKIGSK